MRIPVAVFLSILLFAKVHAQVTLVRSAPNDSFDLACPRCTLAIADVSITNGQHAIPMNLQKPVAVNLLMWRYFDKILGRDVLTRKEQLWTTCTQLIEEVPVDEMLSLHINLDWTDSTGQVQRIFMVIAGLTRPQLAKLPLEGSFEADTYIPHRFAAIAQVTDAEGYQETYDCIQGACTLEHFDLKTGAISGHFEFAANRIGMEKRGFFRNGIFHR